MEKIRQLFGLTENGARGLMKASISAFWMYIFTMLPVMLVMTFVQGLLDEKGQSCFFFIGSILGLAIFMYGVFYSSYNTSYEETYRESSNLRIEIAEILKNLPLSYFSKHNLSDLSQTIMKDVAEIEHAMSHAIPQALGFILYFVVIVTMMLYGNLLLGICVLCPIVVSFVCLLLSKQMQIRASTKYYHFLRGNSEAFQETIELQQEMKSYNKVEEVQKQLFQRMEETEKVHIETEIFQAIPTTLSSCILRFTLGLTMMVGISLYVQEEISLLYFLGYLIAAAKMVEGVNSLYLNIAEMLYIDARIGRIRELRQVKTQQGEKTKIESYDIELRGVSFSYHTGQKVIDSVSFLAKQNEVTALVGPSGCGKTSLLKIISRLYDYDCGSILIGGKEISNIEVESLFEKISIVFQDVVLFNQSILENIRIGNREASDEEVVRASQLANCDEFIQKLPQKYNTVIGENGSQLSGGERQRISIARAFLKDAPVIILDEVSASLDIENEMKIQESLSKLIQGKTVIVISHRLKSIEKADQIVVLEAGKVEAIGKHEELKQDSKLYQKMLKMSQGIEEYQY